MSDCEKIKEVTGDLEHLSSPKDFKHIFDVFDDISKSGGLLGTDRLKQAPSIAQKAADGGAKVIFEGNAESNSSVQQEGGKATDMLLAQILSDGTIRYDDIHFQKDGVSPLKVTTQWDCGAGNKYQFDKNFKDNDVSSTRLILSEKLILGRSEPDKSFAFLLRR